MRVAPKTGRAFSQGGVRWCLLGLLTVALGSSSANAQSCATQPCPAQRAMWINQTPYDVVRVPAERDYVLAFASCFNINEFFLSVTFQCPSPDSCSIGGSTYRQQLRDTIRAAHQAGIRVHALSGHPELALSANHIQVLARIQAVLAFNNGGSLDEKFDGIHLDVEPYALQEYKDAERQGQWDIVRDILVQFLDMNAAAVSELTGQDLAYGVDLPDFWHPFVDEFGVYQERAELKINYAGIETYPTYHVLNIVKEATLMSYHADPDTMKRKTEYALNYAAQLDVPASLYIGAQTAPVCLQLDPPFPPSCRPAAETLGQMTRSQMEQVLCATLYDTFVSLNSFRGFSYFKYSTYRDMSD